LLEPSPPIDSTDFQRSLLNEWVATNGKSVEKWAFSSFLAQEFKSKRNSPNRFYIFLLWLCLCIDRPWKKGWRLSIKENLLIEAGNLLDKFISNSQDIFPDLSTLRKRLGQKNARDKIINAALGPEQEKFRLIMTHFSFSLAKLGNAQQRRNLRIRMWFIWLTRKDPIRKRYLMRKLRINKNEMDGLIV
jgi:hypothetical protein